MTTVIEDKLQKYRSIEQEIQGLFVKKTTTLAQFNENTLVKGVCSLGIQANLERPTSRSPPDPFPYRTAVFLLFLDIIRRQELDLLSEGDPVYKLVGPVLMAVDLEESKDNVTKRIEFIEAEVKKFDAAIAEKQGEQATLGDEIAKLQQEMQASAASAAQAVANQATAAAN